MTAQEIHRQLKALGKENTSNIYLRHGATVQYGVKIEDLKKIQKGIKKNYELSLELYDSGVSDAQYLAGLIADEKKMTLKDLQHWADTASWYLVSEYTVAWIASESDHGWELALRWIDAAEEHVQTAGWSTLSSLTAIKADKDLDIPALRALLQRVEKTIHESANRTRYAMNGFVIAVGGYVAALTEEAIETGKRIGKVKVDMGGTACKVPSSPEYIQKMKDKGYVGKKRKMARC